MATVGNVTSDAQDNTLPMTEGPALPSAALRGKSLLEAITLPASATVKAGTAARYHRQSTSKAGA